MKKYRVWLKDIALQAAEVEAASKEEARRIVEAQLAEGDIAFEPIELEQSLWEIESVEELTN